MPKFNERLKLLRQETGLSQQDFAKQVGLSKSSVNMYERGEREPGLETLEAIADYFNVDPTLIRLGLVLLACTGSGILAYFIAAIIIPDQPRTY